MVATDHFPLLSDLILVQWGLGSSCCWASFIFTLKSLMGYYHHLSGHLGNPSL